MSVWQKLRARTSYTRAQQQNELCAQALPYKHTGVAMGKAKELRERGWILCVWVLSLVQCGYNMFQNLFYLIRIRAILHLRLPICTMFTQNDQSISTFPGKFSGLGLVVPLAMRMRGVVNMNYCCRATYKAHLSFSTWLFSFTGLLLLNRPGLATA